jgi:hypothetical protein
MSTQRLCRNRTVKTNRMELGKMAVDRRLLRHALRARRTGLAATTLLASSASRRGAFSSAMQQFEELMSASAAVGPASRPITLYYATVQAGLAVAAVHKPNPWSFKRHGLTLDNVATTIADVSIRPEGTGAFQVVAQATGSVTLDAPVTLGALWSSLPDFEGLQLPTSSSPMALGIYEDQPPLTVEVTHGMEAADKQRPRGPQFYATVIVSDEDPGPETFKTRLSDLLRMYPGMEGFTVVDGTYWKVRENRWSAQV